MFRNYVEPCVEFIVQSLLNIRYGSRDVYVSLGKLLSSLITFLGPELDEATELRTSCFTACTVMQKHSDVAIQLQALQCIQEMHMFATRHVSLQRLVPQLMNALVSREFRLRQVAVSCLR